MFYKLIMKTLDLYNLSDDSILKEKDCDNFTIQIRKASSSR